MKDVDCMVSDKKRMEFILHRVNTLHRASLGNAFKVDRLEVDLWYLRGSFILSHDRPLGPLILGRSGVEFSSHPWLPIHWNRSNLTLTALLRSMELPLFIHLKNRWTLPALRHLALMLTPPQERNIVLGATNWKTLDRYRLIDPFRALYYLDVDLYFPGDTSRIETIRQRVRTGRLTGGISLRAKNVPFVREMLATFLSSGCPVCAWDIPNPTVLASLLHEPISGLIVDDPSWKNLL